MELQRTEAASVFLLSREEREALVRILRVVEDNWWLDDVEHALLARFEGTDATAIPAA